MLKNLSAKSKALILMIVILLLMSLIKKPVCYFPEEEIEGRDPVEKDISLKEERLKEEGVTAQLHSGTSMVPYINPGEVCLCEKQEEYHVGDAISFYTYYDDELIFVVHRIYDILPSGKFLTLGDNNNKTIDPWILDKEQVFCRIMEKSLLESAMDNMFKGG